MLQTALMTRDTDSSEQLTAKPRRRMRSPSRRSFVLGSAAVLLRPCGLWGLAHSDFGPVAPPLKMPDIPLVCSNGASRSLQSLAEGNTTAIQLMFTACTTTCPIQGTIFRHVQRLIPDQLSSRIQLLSLSIDPQADGPAVLQSWLGHYQSKPGWLAAAPRAENLEAMRRFFGAGTTPGDNHTTQVSLIDRRGMLVYRTEELPDPAIVADLLRQIAKATSGSTSN